MNNLIGLIVASLQTTGAAPDWFLLFKEGWGQLADGQKFLIDQASFEIIAKYFASRGNDLVIDYEHATVDGGKAPASGWIKELKYTDGKGIEAKVAWTEEAAEYVKKGEYRYFSPVFFVRKSDGRVTGVHSVALTNAPKINNLTPILAKLELENNKEGEKTMNELLKKLIAKLKLAVEATEDQVMAAIESIVAKNTELEKQVAAKPKEIVAKSITEALELKEGDDASVVVASIHALRQSGKNMVSREEFDKVKKDLLSRDVTEIVAKAQAEGKITPDQETWAKAYAERDLEGFKTFVAKAPVVIPVSKLPEPRKTDEIIADEAVLTVAKLLGNTQEDIKKFGLKA